MIWLTGDTHYFHSNIIKYTRRPFLDIWEMNAALATNWKARVAPEDTVYCLGDFAFVGREGRYEDEVRKLFASLPGKKILIKGNHDAGVVLQLPWEAIHREAIIVDGVVLAHEGEKYVRKHPGAKDTAVFTAHVHDVYKMRANVLNVGVDVWWGRPVEWTDALAYWEDRFNYYKTRGKDA